MRISECSLVFKTRYARTFGIFVDYGMKWFRHPQVLVYLQVCVLLYFILMVPWTPESNWIWPEIIGLATMVWALFAMGLTTFSVFPQPKTAGKFTDRGPYRFVRHPMYSGLLLVLLSLTFSSFSWLNLGVLLFFTLLIVVKLSLEEQMLQDTYSSYKEYMKRTRKLIPFIW